MLDKIFIKPFIYIGFSLYLFWCKFYTFFQRLFKGKQYTKIKKLVEMYFDSIKEIDVPLYRKWSMINEHFNFKWRADKWYMLWDVISDPYLSLYNHGDDCDGFANCALHFFGEEIIHENKKFNVGF